MEAKPDQQEPDLFERLFVETVLEIATKQMGMSKRALASKVFPGKGSPERALYAILGITETKKPQRLTVTDAYRMALAIGKDFPSLCWYVQKEMERRQAGSKPG